MGTSFVLFISRLCKLENDGFGIRKDLRERLDQLVVQLIKDLGRIASEEAEKCGRILLRSKDYDASISIYFGEGALERVIKKEAWRSVESGGVELVLPMNRIRRCSDKKIRSDGLMYLGGLLEQVLIEIFDQVIVISKKRGKKNMTLKDLGRGIKDDKELERLFSDT